MRNIMVAAALALTAPAAAETVMQHATGTFTVTIKPVAQNSADGVGLGRLEVQKIFSGGLVASASGDMLTGDGPVRDSGAYVLIERVTGTVGGRTGSFAFMHHATMDGGKPDQHITIVPGSGSGGLAGIAGAMTMRIDGGVHHYDLAYALPAQ